MSIVIFVVNGFLFVVVVIVNVLVFVVLWRNYVLYMVGNVLLGCLVFLDVIVGLIF